MIKLRAIALVLGVIGMTIGPWMAYDNLASRSWRSTAGTVLRSDIGSTPRNYRVVLQYRFQAGDRTYMGHRYRPSGSLVDTESEARSIAAQFPTGAQVTVFYDPNDPRDSALRTGLEGRDAVLPLLGLAGILYALWPRTK